MVRLRNNFKGTLVLGNIRLAPGEIVELQDSRVNEEFEELINKAIEQGFIQLLNEDFSVEQKEVEEQLPLPEVNNEGDVDDYTKLFDLHWRAFEKELEKIDDINVITELEQYAIENDKPNAYKKALHARKLALQRDDE